MASANCGSSSMAFFACSMPSLRIESIPAEANVELIGRVDGTFKGNRHIVFPDNVQRCSNMLLSILDLYDIHRESLGDSTGRLPGLA
jgi:hypothetical protein